MEAKHVYTAINAVTAVMAKEGLAKTRKNEQQGYKFRGIDEVYNALSGHLADAKLCILPRVIDRAVSERPTKSGSLSTYVVLSVEFDLVSAVDGSSHTIRTMGEAMDTGDKATNKAMSAAMKYACLIAFQIPTEGDNDADATTHEHGRQAFAKPEAVKAEKGASDEAEQMLATLFALATTHEKLKAAQQQAAEAVKAGALTSAAANRLREKSQAASARLNGAAA